MELASYALMWLQARRHPDKFGYRDSKGKLREALDTPHARWTVLAPTPTSPRDFYDERYRQKLQPFETAMNNALATLAAEQCGVQFEFTFRQFDYQAWLPTAHVLKDVLANRQPI